MTINFVEFPNVTNASHNGLLAMGGDLSLDRLVSAYAQGIFPWFNQGEPILWWSPDPRLVIFPDKINISKSMRKLLRSDAFSRDYVVTANTAFSEVLNHCALRGLPPEQASENTWITTEMRQAYNRLHQAGYAHSIEVWYQQQLMGGLYGVVLGNVFFGESMFSRRSNTSKIALISLCQFLHHQQYRVIDCQVSNEHLISMGAEAINRSQLIEWLKDIDINAPDRDFADNFAAFYDQSNIY